MLFNVGHRLLDDNRVKVRDSFLRPNLRAPARNDDIRRGESATTEDRRIPCEVVSDRLRPNNDLRALRRFVNFHQRPTAQGDRLHVRHREVGAHATDLDERGRLAGEARGQQHADIRRRAADVRDDRRLARTVLVQTREERRAALDAWGRFVVALVTDATTDVVVLRA